MRKAREARALLIRGASPQSSHALEIEAYAGFDRSALEPVMDPAYEPERGQFTLRTPDGAMLAAPFIAARHLKGTIMTSGEETTITFRRRSSTPWAPRSIKVAVENLSAGAARSPMRMTATASRSSVRFARAFRWSTWTASSSVASRRVEARWRCDSGATGPWISSTGGTTGCYGLLVRQ